MAKRSTIGENPLDAVVAGTSLDAVVPDPLAPIPTGRPQPLAEQFVQEAQARLEELEAENNDLKAEVAQLKAEKGALSAESARLQAEDNALKAELAQVKAENGQLSEELAQIRAEVIELRLSEKGSLPTPYPPRRRCN